MASRRIGMFGVEPSESTDDRNEDGVAALLRRRREELERDIDTVARQLRIRAIYIRAIEEGRLQDLPGTAYAVGFVRAYADYLGLDGNSIVSDYRDELARRSRQNQLIWPVDQVEHKHFPSGIILVVSLILAVVLYGGWYFVSQPGGTGIDLIDRVPGFMKKDTAEESTDPVEGAAVAPTSTTMAEAATPEPATSISNTVAQAATEPSVPLPVETPTAGMLPAAEASLAPVASSVGSAAMPPSLASQAATGTPPVGSTATAAPATTVQPVDGGAATPPAASVADAAAAMMAPAVPATTAANAAGNTPAAHHLARRQGFLGRDLRRRWQGRAAAHPACGRDLCRARPAGSGHEYRQCRWPVDRT